MGGVTAGDVGRRKQGKIKDGAKEADLDGTLAAHPIGSRSDQAKDGLKTERKCRRERQSPNGRGFKHNTTAGITAPFG